MKNVIFTSPISLYSWVPILACACIGCVINEKSKFYTKIAQDRKKKHLRLNIPFSGFGRNLFLFILVLCCQGVIRQFLRNVACFMRRFKLKISASGTCQNNHATL
jgi:hypothetical protein